MGAIRNTTLHKMLGKRDMTVEKLAEQIFTSRSHLTQVLLGQRRGGVTWSKLKRVLNEEEYKQAWDYAEAIRAGLAESDAGRADEKRRGFLASAPETVNA